MFHNLFAFVISQFSNKDKSVKEEQFLNIYSIFSIFEVSQVSKPDKSVKEVQFSNMLSISFILFVTPVMTAAFKDVE